jgi:hypothetical protein
MTINLSQHQGGGNLFTPAWMEFDGVDGLWDRAGVTWDLSSGWSLVFMFDLDSFLTATWPNNYLVNFRGASARQVCTVIAEPSDDATQANKINIFSQNGSGTNLFNFRSTEVMGAGKFALLASYNPSTGAGGMWLNDVLQQQITLTTGTIATGSAEKRVGALATNFRTVKGQMSYFGFDNSFIDFSVEANRRLFFDAANNPKDYDFSSWLVGNEHGDLSNNKGTEPNFTRVGSIVVGNRGNDGHPPLGMNTDGTAVAGDILIPKTAWVDGVEVIGSNITSDIAGGSTLLFWDFMQLPNGALTGDEQPQFKVDGITVDGIVNLAKTAAGVSNASASNGLLRISNLPTQTGRRRYVLTMDLDESGATNTLFDFHFNRVDGNNYWQYRLIDQAGDWVTLIYEWTAAVSTERCRNTWNSAIEHCTNIAIIEDYGDEVCMTDITAENGTGNIVRGATSDDYYVASRPNKTGVGCYLQWLLQNGADRIRLQNIWIQDF